MADTRRDIMRRNKVNAEDIAHYFAWLERHYTGDPAVAGATKTICDKINANVAQITADMAAFGAAAP